MPNTDAAIIAHWDIPQAWDSHAQKKYWIRWSHTAKAFGITKICMVETDPCPEWGDAEIELTRVKTLDEALEHFSDYTPVFIEQGGRDYQKYKYPKNPVFVVGGDYGSLPHGDVSIDTGRPLHADISLGIVLGGAKWR